MQPKTGHHISRRVDALDSRTTICYVLTQVDDAWAAPTEVMATVRGRLRRPGGFLTPNGKDEVSTACPTWI